jgi:hypothetical protein
MALGAFPPAPFLPSPDFVAWLDNLPPMSLPPQSLPIPEEPDE